VSVLVPLIRVCGVRRTYRLGETPVAALDGVSLTIGEGEFVALVGPSGSGKSTLLNLLGGLDRPSAGALWVGDLELGGAEDAVLTQHRRRRVGFVFQSFNLLPRLTALENVALPLVFAGLPLRERRARAERLLKRVGLSHRLRHYPGQLSGGEQQRVAIARALANYPSLLLADEPTGNLDTASGGGIMALLHELNRSDCVTVVVVTHDAAVADYADRVVYLRDGQIAQIEERVP
jgi:putative ABC transport system ATP-binding protein